MSVRISRADIVLDGFRSSGNRIIHMAVKNFMQLKNIVLRNRDYVKTLVNDSQHIPVTGYFLFVTVPWSCLFRNQLSDTCARCNDPLNRVGCLRALDLRDFNKLFKLFRPLLQVHFLFPRLFVDSGNIPKQFRIPFLIFDQGVIKGTHSLTSAIIPLILDIF